MKINDKWKRFYMGAAMLMVVSGITFSEMTKAPDFELLDIHGNTVQLSVFKGKIVVLEWTNYDCPFVKPHYGPETYTMRDLAARYADKNVVWLTINSTHYATLEANRQWAQRHQLKQTVLLDADGKVGKLFDAKTTPHMFIVNEEGYLVYRGAIDNAPRGRLPQGRDYINYVDQALAELTSGKPVTQSQTSPYGCSVKYAATEKAS